MRRRRPSPGPARAFAVPERDEEHPLLGKRTVVLREASEEDEEELVRARPRSMLDVRGLGPERFEKWFVLLLFLLGSLTVLADNYWQQVGMAWDEAYYVDAGHKTLAWVDACRGSQAPPIRGAALDQYWDAYTYEPRGHAAVTRWLVAAGMLLAPHEGSPLFAMRLPMALCFGMTLVVLYLLGRRYYGRVTGSIAVVVYFFLPRVFGDAHFALTETPMTLLALLTIYAFLRGLESRRWAVATGVFFGLALATKANALLLPAILLPWALLFRPRDSARNIYSMALLAPLVTLAVWPWMWDKPILHFAEYLVWNFSHSQIGVLFLGKIYTDATVPVPWHYSLTLTGLTLPVVSLVLVAFGVARSLHVVGRNTVSWLILWAAAVPLLAMVPAGTPKYDGVRLFLPAFPFVALLAGIGGAVLVRMGAFFDRPAQRLPRGQLVLFLVVLAVVIEGGWALWSVRPNYLTYFNLFTGGSRVAAFEKMEMTYWGEAFNREAAQEVNRQVPDGKSLTPRAMNIEVLRYYQQWGWLKRSIVLVEDRSADFNLLQYRRGMFVEPDRYLFDHRFSDESPRIEFPSGPKEVPLIGLFPTGDAFARAHLRPAPPAEPAPAPAPTPAGQ
jgi:4-amino-4-deoxy-L-arabinose transferase-like glycosyltransferase